MPPDLRVELGPIALCNPLICGSGEHVSTLADLRAAIDAGAAAVVAKSANESDAARAQADATEWVWLDHAHRPSEPASDEVSLLNRSGLVQVPWTEWLDVLADADDYARSRQRWVLASIIPGATEHLPELARDVEAAGLRWLELNLSAPHSGEAPAGAIERPVAPARVHKLTSIVREAVSIPLTVKLGAESDDVTALAGAASSAGADAIAMVGRHMGFVPDPETRRAVLGSFGGYSGPWALPIAMRWVAKTRLALGSQTPLIGTNGARSGIDVASFMLAGASAVQVATSVLREGFIALQRMLGELTDYLNRQQRDARQIIGEASDGALSYADAATWSRP